MKNTQKMTFAALMAALSSALMLVSYFPYFTYAVPAVSGLFIMVVFIEVGTPYALFSFAVSAAISLLVSEKESALLYLLLFGFYPLVKAKLEVLKKPVIEWIIKLAVFNVSAVLSYFAASFVVGVGLDDFALFGKYGVVIFLVICNGVFVLYDIAVSRVAMFYFSRLHENVIKIFKK